MALIITTTVPRLLLLQLLPDFDVKGSDDAWTRAQVRTLVETAVERGVRPVAMALADVAGATVKVNFSIGGVVESAVRAGMLSHQNSPAKYIRALLAGMASMPVVLESGVPRSCSRSLLAEIVEKMKDSVGLTPRAEQDEFFGQLSTCLSGQAIGLCEAGTGTGKTLAMLAAAIEQAVGAECRVLLAVPTIQLMTQFAKTYRQIENVMDVPPLRTVLGRREFVSPAAISSLVESGMCSFDTDAVRCWVEGGGEGVVADAGEPFLTQRWLAGSLVAVCPEFPVDEVLIDADTPENDPGQMSYRGQFSERFNLPEIMLATHAMTAVDLRSKFMQTAQDDESVEYEATLSALMKALGQCSDVEEKRAIKASIRAAERENARRIGEQCEETSILPPYTFCLIDEAHLLESNFSSALSDYASIKSFHRNLKSFKDTGGRVSTAVLQGVRQLVERMSDISDIPVDEMVSLSSHEGKRFVPLLAEMVAVVGKLSAPKNGAGGALSAYRNLQRTLAILKTAARENSSHGAFIRLSPSRAWPQVYIGKRSVAKYLKLLWEGVRAGAAVSATLYLRKEGTYSAGYQRTLLAIPEDRAREFPPVTLAWSIRPVKKLYVPEYVLNSAEERAWLRPPTRSDGYSVAEKELAELAWIDQVAKVLAWIHTSAEGGVFVPMTSYSSIKLLAHALPVDLRLLLVCAASDFTLARQCQRYVSMQREGKRPIWLAVGSAWTGLDLNGANFGIDDPREDNLITDLVVPRLPFGTNRTITHQARMVSQPTVPWEVLETAFKLKQVMGRPVRRDGLTRNRRYWMLDGRLSDPRFVGYTNVLRRLFDPYEVEVLTQDSVVRGQRGPALER